MSELASPTDTAPPREPAAPPALRLGAILTIACLANFMVIVDTSIVNVALPDMRASLGLSSAGQQWVISGYLVTFGGFLLLAARAGDLFGRRRVFQIGLVIFTLASLVGGLAGTPGVLIGARVAQGVGAAILATSSLSLLTANFTEGAPRTHALSLWAAVGSSAGAFGLVLGGVLTAELSWRYVLFVNVPVGVVLFVAAATRLPAATTERHASRLDLPGALSVTAGVALLVYGLSQAGIDGWRSGTVVAALCASAVLLAFFAIIETRSAAPLVPFAAIKQRSLAVGNAIMSGLGIVMTAGLFFLSLYLQQALGYSALRTGLAMVPLSVLLAAGPLIARRLLPRYGARTLTVVGAVVTTGGVAWMSFLPDHSAYAARILGPLLVTGAGIGLMLLPLTAAATAGVDARYAGLASGLFNMARQLGGAIGLAVLVTVATTATSHSPDPHSASALVHGYHVALLVCAAISAAVAVVALLLGGANRRAAA